MRRLFLIAFLLGCGPEARPEAEEPPTETLRLEGWPPLTSVQSSAVVRMLAIAEALPGLPPADGIAWVEGVFVPWMAQRQEALATAAELRRQVRREGSAEQTIAVALHGAILQATHDSLAGAHAERIDPAAGEALAGPAAALAEKARAAYEVCHQLALDAGPALDGWRHGCDEHLARLPADD